MKKKCNNQRCSRTARKTSRRRPKEALENRLQREGERLQLLYPILHGLAVVQGKLHLARISNLPRCLTPNKQYNQSRSHQRKEHRPGRERVPHQHEPLAHLRHPNCRRPCLLLRLLHRQSHLNYMALHWQTSRRLSMSDRAPLIAKPQP